MTNFRSPIRKRMRKVLGLWFGQSHQVKGEINEKSYPYPGEIPISQGRSLASFHSKRTGC